MLLDRLDCYINLCEIKFLIKTFVVDKKYAESLNLKRLIFLAKTNTKKSIFITLLTTMGVGRSNYFRWLFCILLLNAYVCALVKGKAIRNI